MTPRWWSGSRRYLLDGRPVETAVSYIPADLAAGTPIADPNPGPGGIYARLEEQGHTLARFTEDVTARMPTPEEARAARPAVLACRCSAWSAPPLTWMAARWRSATR